MLKNTVETINPEAKSTIFVLGSSVVVEVRPALDNWMNGRKDYDLTIKNGRETLSTIHVGEGFNYGTPIVIGGVDAKRNPFKVIIKLRYARVITCDVTVDDMTESNKPAYRTNNNTTRTRQLQREANRSVAAARAAGVSESRIMHSTDELNHWLAAGRTLRA
jgi:hypothetical protein